MVESQEQELLVLHLKSWTNEYVKLAAHRNQAKVTEKESGNNLIAYVALGVAQIALHIALLKNN
ncbi:hypothetical protein [Pontibacter oryzae]|uniref:Uncharacterized protein n=1 Tax=Pontibacter oryzae TaxID=2304593 RepID=A0A399S3M2_9BACT|nr:hypothetical protein [Pontibacter oryzae]RIJ37069.1 hypothetical protein D1627_14775 [Pontibacter oryzae]